MVVTAELLLRHTRRHMPTRRVAPGTTYLPMAGNHSPGELLVGAIVHEFAPQLDDDDRDELVRLLPDAARGLDLPRIAVRYRLQRDTHGLDRSRHRVEEVDGRVVVELDVHGAALPQLLGTVLAVSQLPPSARQRGLARVRSVLSGANPHQRAGVVLRRLTDGLPYEIPLAAGAQWRPGGPVEEVLWEGVDSELRWAMEVLGLPAGTVLRRTEVNRRFRRLLRDAHPDTGAARVGAAERIEELTVARDRLLDLVVLDDDDGVGEPAGPADASAPGGRRS